MSNKRRPIRALFFLFPLFFILLLSAAVMLLWNAVLPDLLGVPAIQYGQAVGLFILSRILFGGFRFNGRRRFGPPWRGREKWAAMSAEEREKFKEEWRKRCSPRSSAE